MVYCGAQYTIWYVIWQYAIWYVTITLHISICLNVWIWLDRQIWIWLLGTDGVLRCGILHMICQYDSTHTLMSVYISPPTSLLETHLDMYTHEYDSIHMCRHQYHTIHMCIHISVTSITMCVYISASLASPHVHTLIWLYAYDMVTSISLYPHQHDCVHTTWPIYTYDTQLESKAGQEQLAANVAAPYSCSILMLNTHVDVLHLNTHVDVWHAITIDMYT